MSIWKDPTVLRTRAVAVQEILPMLWKA